MNFETLTIDCPRPDIYGGIPAQQSQDAPTVADYTPYATAQTEKLTEPFYKSLGELWGANLLRVDDPSIYLGM